MKTLLYLMTLMSFFVINMIGVIAFNGWDATVLNPNVNKEYMLIAYLGAVSYLVCMSVFYVNRLEMKS